MLTNVITSWQDFACRFIGLPLILLLFVLILSIPSFSSFYLRSSSSVFSSSYFISSSFIVSLPFLSSSSPSFSSSSSLSILFSCLSVLKVLLLNIPTSSWFPALSSRFLSTPFLLLFLFLSLSSFPSFSSPPPLIPLSLCLIPSYHYSPPLHPRSLFVLLRLLLFLLHLFFSSSIALLLPLLLHLSSLYSSLLWFYFYLLCSFLLLLLYLLILLFIISLLSSLLLISPLFFSILSSSFSLQHPSYFTPPLPHPFRLSWYFSPLYHPTSLLLLFSSFYLAGPNSFSLCSPPPLQPFYFPISHPLPPSLPITSSSLFSSLHPSAKTLNYWSSYAFGDDSLEIRIPCQNLVFHQIDRNMLSKPTCSI